MNYDNGEYEEPKEKPIEECRNDMPINSRNIKWLNYAS